MEFLPGKKTRVKAKQIGTDRKIQRTQGERSLDFDQEEETCLEEERERKNQFNSS